MKKRIITGLILGAVAIGLIWLGDVYFAVAALVCVCFALAEEIKALRRAGYRVISEPTWIALGISIPLALHFGHVVVLPILIGASMVIIAGVVFRELPEELARAKGIAPQKAEGEAEAAGQESEAPREDMSHRLLLDAVMSLVPLYSVALPGLAVISLCQITTYGVQRMMLLMLIAVPVIGDTAALFVGRALGRAKLCPSVSPHKTVAGAVGGLAGSLAAALLVLLGALLIASPQTSGQLPGWVFCIVVGLLGGIAGQLGDLFASMVKRHCGIKDFSEIFPGHGGMLDRLDSILFMALVLYCCRLLFYNA